MGKKADINDNEYQEIKKKSFYIIKKFKKYVDDYIDFKNNCGNEFIAMRYKFSTL